ncbi:FAD/NAD(P)-binding oxidoreductase [Actinidia rufa]|uniref:FAD/NAD(P)-binding oxidoreductase n=1 Tax=Actinidia rufa TaxID=165716 RepID=A0A7J0HEJ2_9ERIC|nr:FAD/NAD(P)-binding oxidoreductase [Actinidia rufa]
MAFFRRHQHRSRLLSVAAAISHDTVAWTSAPIAEVRFAGERLCYVTIDIANSPGLVANFVRAGQYIQIRIPDELVNPPPSPALFYIASPPSLVAKNLEFEFLGRGLDIDQLSPPEDYPTVLLFATGYGISPIRSLIETGFSANKRSDVRLYYGAENLRTMPYQDRFKNWESSGVKVIPVLSRPDANWPGETGYIQDVYAEDNPIADPRATGAVLCGNPNMIEATRALLVAQGVSPEKILVTRD